MTFKLFFSWVAAAEQRCVNIADAILRVRHAPRPCLERTSDPIDARAHALGSSYFGLLTGLDAHR